MADCSIYFGQINDESRDSSQGYLCIFADVKIRNCRFRSGSKIKKGALKALPFYIPFSTKILLFFFSGLFSSHFICDKFRVIEMYFLSLLVILPFQCLVNIQGNILT